MQNITKRKILDSFEVPETHPTLEQLQEKLNDKEINLQELKILLEHLEKEGKIYSVPSTDGHKHFGKTKGKHFHFICDECGAVKDVFFSEGSLDMIRDHAQKLLKDSCRIERTNISFQGTCFNCKNT